MGHQAGHVAFAIANACNIVERAIGIARGVIRAVWSRITEKDLSIVFKVSKRGFVGAVIAVVMGDWDFQDLALRSAAGKGRIGLLNADEHVPANVAKTRIAYHGSGKQAGFEKNLKAIADAKNHATRLGESFDGLHHRRKSGDRAGTQVIPIGKSAG